MVRFAVARASKAEAVSYSFVHTEHMSNLRTHATDRLGWKTRRHPADNLGRHRWEVQNPLLHEEEAHGYEPVSSVLAAPERDWKSAAYIALNSNIDAAILADGCQLMGYNHRKTAIAK